MVCFEIRLKVEESYIDDVYKMTFVPLCRDLDYLGLSDQMRNVCKPSVTEGDTASYDEINLIVLYICILKKNNTRFIVAFSLCI